VLLQIVACAATPAEETPVTSPSERIKGTLLLARLKFLRGRGEGTLDQVIRTMSDEHQRQLRGMILPSSWYPLDLLRSLESAMVAALRYASRTELFLDMGGATATANLTGTGSQRVYVRESDPHFLLRHSPYIYASAHTAGSRSYEPTGEHSAVLRTTRSEVRREDCLTTVGWLGRAIEIAGGRDVRVVETQCGAEGAAWCEYRCEWRPADSVAARAR
jgi:uncharacterized protein (TIGR02265 family)